jgi:hypothetical protein
MSRVAELRARREALLLRSATLRMQLVMHGDELEHAAVRVDRGISFARMLTAKPVVLLAGAGLLLSIGPGRVFRWISRGLFLTSVARRAYGILALTHRRG